MSLADKKSAYAPQQIVKTNPTGRHTQSPITVNGITQTINRTSPIEVSVTTPIGRHEKSAITPLEKTPLAGE